MKHTRLEHAADKGCDTTGCCTICELFICAVCGGAEGSLTTDCPGSAAIATLHKCDQKVYAGKIDFVGTHWINKEVRP